MSKAPTRQRSTRPSKAAKGNATTASPSSDVHHAEDQARLDALWPKLGPFPWLRSMEVMINTSKALTKDVKGALSDMLRFVREEMRERGAMSEGEVAYLRILRACDAQDRRQLLLLLLEQGARMPTADAQAYIASLNFETLGTGGVR